MAGDAVLLNVVAVGGRDGVGPHCFGGLVAGAVGPGIAVGQLRRRILCSAITGRQPMGLTVVLYADGGRHCQRYIAFGDVGERNIHVLIIIVIAFDSHRHRF